MLCGEDQWRLQKTTYDLMWFSVFVTYIIQVFEMIILCMNQISPKDYSERKYNGYMYKARQFYLIEKANS